MGRTSIEWAAECSGGRRRLARCIQRQDTALAQCGLEAVQQSIGIHA